MSRDANDKLRRPRTLGEHVRLGLSEAHAWRPASFYMLLAMPVVLALGAHMFRYQDDPLRFASILALQFVFFGIVAGRAIKDMFQISRKRLSVARRDWEETLGEARFQDKLRANREAVASDFEARS